MTTTIRGPRASTALAALVALLAAAALLLVAAAPRVAAHDGDAVVEVERAEVSGLTVDYVVRVTWADDGHAAVDATVTATAIGADGSQLTPVALNPIDTDGRYGGAVELPAAGDWTVRFTSIEPTGTLEVEQQVAAPTTAAPTTAPPTTAVDAADTGAGDAGASDDEIAADETAAQSDDGESGGMPVAVILIAAVVVIGGAVAAVRTIVRTRANPPAAAGGHADDDTPS